MDQKEKAQKVFSVHFSRYKHSMFEDAALIGAYSSLNKAKKRIYHEKDYHESQGFDEFGISFRFFIYLSILNEDKTKFVCEV